jgi:hypothetical protein
LYREPILRKIADRYPVPKSEKENQSCRKLLAKIFENRETASLEEICKCLDVCGSSSLHTKIRVLTSLPSLLISLSREDGQKVLRSMFNLVDKDKKLGISLAESDIFEKIEESLGDDQQSKILLELCLHSRNLLYRNPDVNVVGFGLSFIPDEKRWQWVLDNVPECLSTSIGMEAMLNDSACQKKIIEYLSKSFSQCTTDLDRLAVCEKISRIYRTLCKYPDGKEILVKVIKWFFKAPPCINSTSGYLKTNYVNSLLNYLPHIKKCMGNKEKKLMQKKLYKAVIFSINAKAYDQSTSLVIAMAKDDINFFSDFSETISCMHDQVVLKRLLKHSHKFSGSDNRDKFIYVLCKAARYHIKSAPEFFDSYMKAADKILEAGKNSKKPQHKDDGSLASES